MSENQRVIRLETNGPAGTGLEKMELNPGPLIDCNSIKSSQFIRCMRMRFAIAFRRPLGATTFLVPRNKPTGTPVGTTPTVRLAIVAVIVE